MLRNLVQRWRTRLPTILQCIATWIIAQFNRLWPIARNVASAAVSWIKPLPLVGLNWLRRNVTEVLSSGDPNTATPRNFLLAIGADWLTLMSGSLSVPFVALGVFSSAAWAQGIWFSLAIVAFLVCVYQVWAKERRQVNDLTKKITPKTMLAFEIGVPYSYNVRVDSPFAGMPPTTYRCYRFVVTNGGAQELNCTAQIKTARTDAGVVLVTIPFSLRRSFLGVGSFPLRIGETTTVDLLAVPIEGPAKIGPAKVAAVGEPWPEVGAVMDAPIVGTALPREPTTVVVQMLWGERR